MIKYTAVSAAEKQSVKRRIEWCEEEEGM